MKPIDFKKFTLRHHCQPPQERRCALAAPPALTFYWQWLATLPLFGAAGTYISRRAEGTTLARFAAGLSPALTMLVVMCIILPFGLAIDGFYFWRLVGFGLSLINWVVIPAIGLMVGALPFLSRSRVAIPKSAE